MIEEEKSMSFDIYNDYKAILEGIEGFFIIDINERIIYMNNNLAKRHGYKDSLDTIGMKIGDVIPEPINTLRRVLYTKKPQLAQIYYYEGDLVVCNGYPIYKDGEIVGACEYDAFTSVDKLGYFINRISSMNEEIHFYKKEYGALQTTKHHIDDIIGSSDAIRSVKGTIYNVAKSNSTVLIHGETGTGKELVAHSIHRCGSRCFNKFVKINCAAIPKSLFEMELFGYEEGSFTDAKRGGQRGKAEIANGGTLFLDEIDELSLTEQPKLLRFLQEKELSRLGSNKNIFVDVRVVAATNKDLSKMVKAGTFREDLYYRLNVIDIPVPPLKERIGDIPELVDYFLKDIAKNANMHTVKGISGRALEVLMGYEWPGNVRQLHNMIERAVNNSEAGTLEVADFGGFFIKNPSTNTQDMLTGKYGLKEIREIAERNAIIDTIKYCNLNSIAQPYRILHISKQAYYNKIRYFNISKEDYL